MKKTKKLYTLIKILAVLSIIIILISVPFFIEKIIMDEKHFPFDLTIELSKESWFGFMASYLGAIGTVILGIIAIWQNKRYKELSDKSSNEAKEIQADLKELSKKTVEAIKTLERIELAIYTPIIERIPYNFYGITKEKLDEGFEDESIVYQKNLINIGDDALNLPLDKLMKTYKTYGFVIRNIGEKALRNFVCLDIKIDGKDPGFIVNYECDITPGECANIIFVNIPINVGVTELNLKFEFNNLIMEKYKFDVDVIITCDEDSFDASFINFEMPIKCD